MPKRSKTLHVKLSRDEDRSLRQKAKERDMTRSEYVRRVVLRGEVDGAVPGTRRDA